MAGATFRGTAASADQGAVRGHNLSLVLRHLRAHGARSRAQVAAETGLNKATVSSLVTDLLERGLVGEGETARGAIGRPGQQIDLDQRHYAVLGCEIGLEYVAVLATTLRGDVLSERRTPLDSARLEPQVVLQALVAEVVSVLDALRGDAMSCLGLTVGVPGIVETATGMVFDAVNLGWRDIAVGDLLGELLAEPLGDVAFPIYLDNEANLAALSELDAHRVDPPTDLLLLTGGPGVGGGIVSGGQLMRGLRGFAGEIGHMQMDLDGAVCGCGRRGCWETVVGLSTLLRLVAPEDDRLHDRRVDVVARLAEVRARAEAGDERTLAAIETISRWLVAGVGNLVNILNPEVLVLGGYFAELGTWFVPALQADLAHHVHAPAAGGCRVTVSTLGFSAAVRGGCSHVISAVLDDPLGVTPLVPAADLPGVVP